MDENLNESASLIALGLQPEEANRAADLQAEISQFQAVACAAALAGTPLYSPPADLKGRLFETLESYRPGEVIGEIFGGEGDACVVTDLEGRVQWVNLAFTEMCGYRLEELRGRKPGHVLQGPDTDPKTAREMSRAIRAHTSCAQDILNYHKDGQPYWASISISPIFGLDRRVRAFVALERILARETTVALA